MSGAAVAGLMLPFGFGGVREPAGVDWLEGSFCSSATAAEPAATGPLKPIKLGWFPNATCLSPVAAAQKLGIFARHGLDVELINFAGTTDQLLEALSTGKADASVGMALRWLKPLEQGFDVKLTAGTHGGCLRLLASKASGITTIEGLRGKTIAVTPGGSPGKNFFSILLARRGFDPARDVEFREYPGDLLAGAVDKGEAVAIAHQDPDTYRYLKRGDFVELATNLSREYANRVCCLIGVRGSLIREDRATAKALTQALLEAQDLTAHHPEQTADAYAQYVTNASRDDIIAILKSHTHGSHPTGAEFKHQLGLYIDELKSINVIRASTDPVRFVDKIVDDVLA
jgi:NitT/TauT family transport system substrate-binding protein